MNVEHLAKLYLAFLDDFVVPRAMRSEPAPTAKEVARAFAAFALPRLGDAPPEPSGERLKEIRARLEAITPWPWSTFMGSGNIQCTALMHEDATGQLHFVADFCPDYALDGGPNRLVRGDHLPDMRFVEHAAVDIAYLLAVVEHGAASRAPRAPAYRPMSNAEMPTDQEWTPHEWAMNQWWLANERAASSDDRALREAALEEAAHIAESHGSSRAHEGQGGITHYEARLIAADIRRLKAGAAPSAPPQ